MLSKTIVINDCTHGTLKGIAVYADFLVPLDIEILKEAGFQRISGNWDTPKMCDLWLKTTEYIPASGCEDKLTDSHCKRWLGLARYHRSYNNISGHLAELQRLVYREFFRQEYPHW